MMKQSYILQQLFKSFHQPPSLSKPESEKLLTRITTSFREHLDREHGEFEFRRDNLHTPTKKTPSTSKTANSSRRRSFSERAVPTQRHFQSILTDPLFTAGNNLESGMGLKPMDVFELAVSKGLMTMEKCHLCLLAEKKSIIGSSAPTVWEGMRDSGAGLKVLKWLRASGLAEEGEYMKHDMFFSVLAQFAVAEGLQEPIRHDFMRLCSSSYLVPRIPGLALVRIIEAELESHSHLDGGISALTQVFPALQSSTRRAILEPGTRLLSHRCTVLSQSYPKPSPDNFSALESMIPRVFISHQMHSAHLALHHPTSPSPRKALSLIKGLPHDNPYVKSSSRSKRFIGLGLDTAKHLLEHEQFEEARDVLRLLSESFPNQLGRDECDRLGHAKSEASSIEWLQGLSLV